MSSVARPGRGRHVVSDRFVVGDRLAVLLTPVLWLGAWLRFYHLGSQSFWNDEGNTARLVERPLRLILAGAAGDIHPPGYYLLLHYWRMLVGSSEFALRSYSALCGILTVAVVAAITRLMAGRPRASAGQGALFHLGPIVVTAFLAAVHPLAVYYAQEARMYAQLGLVSALTLWLGVRMMQRRARKAWWREGTAWALGLCIAAGLYTQYTYVLVLVGLDAALALDWLWRPARHRIPPWAWFLSHGLACLLFAPWAPVARRALGWAPPDLGTPGALQAMGKALLVGRTYPAPLPLWAWGAMALLLLGALYTSLHTAVSRRRLVLWGALGVSLLPPILIVVASIYRPAYLKFLMMTVPGLTVALGAITGESRIRLLALLPLAALLSVQSQALYHLYTDPAYVRDDYRGLAAYIREEGRPGDAILLDAPNQWEVFTYYYPPDPRALPVYPAPYRPDQKEAEAWVRDIIARHEGGRLFVLFWGDREADPQGWIERALATQAYKAGERWVTTIRLARYGAAPLAERPGVAMTVEFGEGIRLEGYHLPDGTWQPEDIMPLTLFWRVRQTPEERLKVFVHLLGADGTLVAQVDMEPQAGTYPTPLWQPGSTIIDRYGVALPSTLPPGTYTLKLGLYRLTGERLLARAVDGTLLGDAVVLGQVQVIAGPSLQP